MNDAANWEIELWESANFIIGKRLKLPGGKIVVAKEIVKLVREPHVDFTFRCEDGEEITFWSFNLLLLSDNGKKVHDIFEGDFEIMD